MKFSLCLLKPLKAALTVIGAAFLISCAALPNVANVISGKAQEQSDNGPLYRYRADLTLTIGEKTFEGMAVAKLNGPVQIKIDSRIKLNYLTINSCGREDVFRQTARGWFGQVGKSFTYEYNPTKTEMSGVCPLYIKAFDSSGLASWGYVAFLSDESLESKIECNGVGQNFQGITVCQTRAGLEQALSFKDTIELFEAGENCQMKRVDDKNFSLRGNPGFCEATFYANKKWARLVFLNYEKPLIRAD